MIKETFKKFKEVFSGEDNKFSKVCQDCNGTGKLNRFTCPSCQGMGRIF